jgi:peptide/nickel transport system substrate-binding protein
MKTILSLLVALTVNLPQKADAALTNEEFKIGIAQEFENLNPLIASMAATNYLYSLVGRALVTLDDNGKWVPQLAKSIPSFENHGAKFVTNAAGKKVVQAVWEIKEGAKWSDGQPVVCADFQLAREIAASNNVAIADRETYTQMEKIEADAKNPKKCTITYDKARWDFFQLGRTYPLPAHIEGPIFKAHGGTKEGYEKNTAYVKSPTQDGLYNGPYRISEVKLGSHVSFVPNTSFYGTQPHIKKLVIKLIPNTGTLEANLRSGTIDSVSSLGFSFDQALAFEKKVKSENLPYVVEFRPSLTFEHIDLNLDNPILKDLKVRKALVYAINRDNLVKALFEGKQTAAIHHMAPIDPWYTADPKKITLYPYNKKEAAKLLDEAGWKLDDKDGFRYKDGKKLSLQFMTTAGNKNREVVQTYLQGQWKAAGIEVVIKNEPARVFFGETMSKRKFESMAMYAWTSSPEGNPKSTFHSASIPTDKNGGAGQNYPGWSNKEVDKLIETLETEFNAKKRVELAHKIAKIYTDDVPVIPLYYRADVAVPPLALKHFRLTGHQYSETNQAELWEITK